MSDKIDATSGAKPPTDATPSSPSTSWWVEDFESNLADAQLRMRNARLPKPVEDYFAEQLKAEEAELLVKKGRGRA